MMPDIVNMLIFLFRGWVSNAVHGGIILNLCLGLGDIIRCSENRSMHYREKTMVSVRDNGKTTSRSMMRYKFSFNKTVIERPKNIFHVSSVCFDGQSVHSFHSSYYPVHLSRLTAASEPAVPLSVWAVLFVPLHSLTNESMQTRNPGSWPMLPLTG